VPFQILLQQLPQNLSFSPPTQIAQNPHTHPPKILFKTSSSKALSDLGFAAAAANYYYYFPSLSSSSS
jgi:hypothetical protein